VEEKMAKVLSPFLSTDAKGTVGGMTASQWRGVKTMRIKAQPVKRLRTQQPVNRSRLAFLVSSWSQLSDDYRQQWRDWAAAHPQPDGFGSTFIMSGINAFTQLNIRRMLHGSFGNYMSAPPVSDLLVSITQAYVIQGAASGQIQLDWAFNGVGLLVDRVTIWLAGPYASGGKVEVSSNFHTVWGVPAINHSVAGNIQTYLLTGLAPSMWYWVGVRYQDIYGQTSPLVIGQAVAKP
jgi:hypothetical protein